MRYNLIDECEAINGEGFGVSLYTQGCPYHCPGCFNPETWDFDKGKEWTQKEEDLIIELLKPDYIKRLTILGGEPLVERNVEPLTALLRRVKHIYPNKKVWLYTGGNFEFESARCNNLIEHTDIVIDGQFKKELRDITLKWKGSSNQRVIDVQKSLKEGETILYE